MLAAASGHAFLVRKLLERGADAEVVDRHALTVVERETGKLSDMLDPSCRLSEFIARCKRELVCDLLLEAVAPMRDT